MKSGDWILASGMQEEWMYVTCRFGLWKPPMCASSCSFHFCQMRRKQLHQRWKSHIGVDKVTGWKNWDFCIIAWRRDFANRDLPFWTLCGWDINAYCGKPLKFWISSSYFTDIALKCTRKVASGLTSISGDIGEEKVIKQEKASSLNLTEEIQVLSCIIVYGIQMFQHKY